MLPLGSGIAGGMVFLSLISRLIFRTAKQALPAFSGQGLCNLAARLLRVYGSVARSEPSVGRVGGGENVAVGSSAIRADNCITG